MWLRGSCPRPAVSCRLRETLCSSVRIENDVTCFSTIACVSLVDRVPSSHPPFLIGCQWTKYTIHGRIEIAPQHAAIVPETGAQSTLFLLQRLNRHNLALACSIRRPRWDVTVYLVAPLIPARSDFPTPGLGGRGDHSAARGRRGGPGARGPGQGRGGVCPLGPVRAAAPADERVGGLSEWGGRVGRPVAAVKPGVPHGHTHARGVATRVAMWCRPGGGWR